MQKGAIAVLSEWLKNYSLDCVIWYTVAVLCIYDDAAISFSVNFPENRRKDGRTDIILIIIYQVYKVPVLNINSLLKAINKM